MELLVKDLAERVGGELVGDGEALVKGFAALSRAGGKDLTFFSSKKAKRDFAASRAACVIAPPETEKPEGVKALILHEDPDRAFTEIYEAELPPAPSPEPEIHATAIVADSATIGEGVYLGPYVVIGEGVTIGDGTKIHPHCVIMEHCSIGKRCTLYPHVVLREGVQLGDEVLLQPGVVLGAEGFGYGVEDGRLKLVPQRGDVRIGDDVHIGANSCVDRARFGTTRVGDGTKIDNLVQIGHNVQIGSTCGIAALSGLGGSSEIEDFVHMSGMTAVADGLKVGAGAKLFGRCGIDRDIEPGEELYWAPARSPMTIYRLFSLFDRLPEMSKLLKRHEKQLAAMAKADQA